ncbi:DnaJ domain-containing protein [Roseospira marina]|uniref:DnaJ domain-containing protein n=1 Tax=Roseospira marina TaxID=140057 RepID=A0A5M6IH41_9PROT|nr:TerB family tellurite resistance protein [Roseospira marina]KAA5607544.1 DnaJ domain-containing protein [Roseospira marina]MBB4312269.1 DnaJ like chaperone protein [Roseospira marina]MBB5085715.1 DnaJ like chaperone protein [Roseospira marina]
MSVWGKIIGGVGGFLVLGPLGALVGAAAGHAVDKEGWPSWLGGGTSDRPGLRERIGKATADARQQVFAVGVIVLGAKMAKADGHVSRDEVAAFKRIFQIPPGDMKAVGAIFDQAKQSADGYEIYARQIARLFSDSPQVLEELLASLYQIARADGGALHPAETAFLNDVARIFGLPPEAINRLHARYERASGDEADPYAVLGVTPNANDEEVRAAWKRLSREHHPDVLMSKGMPEEFIAQANEKMAAINHAYDRVRERRGLK